MVQYQYGIRQRHRIWDGNGDPVNGITKPSGWSWRLARAHARFPTGHRRQVHAEPGSNAQVQARRAERPSWLSKAPRPNETAETPGLLRRSTGSCLVRIRSVPCASAGLGPSSGGQRTPPGRLRGRRQRQTRHVVASADSSGFGGVRTTELSSPIMILWPWGPRVVTIVDRTRRSRAVLNVVCQWCQWCGPGNRRNREQDWTFTGLNCCALIVTRKAGMMTVHLLPPRSRK
jgi:hypothetical protein